MRRGPRFLVRALDSMHAGPENEMRGKKTRPPCTRDIDQNAKYFYLGQKNVGIFKEFNF
jgi:hypothetical protein